MDKFISAGKLNHASTIHTFGHDAIIAWYAGDAECHPSQRVYITLFKDGNYHFQLSLEELTGNPVLIPVTTTRAMLLYSRFEQFPSKRVEWWQYCSLWYRFIDYKSGTLSISDKKKFKINVPFGNGYSQIEMPLGYLGRCNSIRYKDEILLPLYKERGHMTGLIVAGKVTHDKVEWTLRGEIAGKNQCLQPTLWSADNTIHAFLRNYLPFVTSKPMVLHSQSEDGGHSWSKPELHSDYFNCNNSIVAVRDDLFIWNNDPAGRKNLSIGNNQKHLLLDDYGAYPAFSVDDNGRIHVTYSGRERAILVIKHKIVDSQTF